MQAADRSFFSLLTPERRCNLMALGSREVFRKGDILFSESDNMEDMVFLLEGYAALCRDSFRGDSRGIFICARGEVLNEVCAEGGRPAVTAIALSDGELLRLPMDKLRVLLSGDAAFAGTMFLSLSRKTRRLYHKVGNDNGTYPLKNRMAATLWKLTRDYGTDTSGGRVLDFELTVNFLATYMGAKRESVSRALSAMKKQKLITHESGVLTVLSMDSLKQAISEE